MNRDRSAVFRWLVSFFTGLTGVLSYLFVTLNDLDDPDRAKACPSCWAEYTGSVDYRPNCGKPIDADADREVVPAGRSGSRAHCGNCHTRVETDAESCWNGGRMFKG